MQYQQPYQAQAMSLRYVGVWRRFLAVLIDGIILGAVYYVVAAATGNLTPTDSGSASLPGGVVAVVAFLYFIILEGFMGATIGKFLLGIRVVKLDGSHIGLGAAIIRNLLRIIDALPTAYILGAILIWTSSRKQRLGDRVAHTVVVRR
jgi:uncharacterized RDD family membrane protein YckC